MKQTLQYKQSKGIEYIPGSAILYLVVCAQVLYCNIILILPKERSKKFCFLGQGADILHNVAEQTKFTKLIASIG